MKNFHICNTFFKHIVDAYIVILLIKINRHKSIDEFKAQVAQFDWPHYIKKVQELYLRPFYIKLLLAKGLRENQLSINTALIKQRKEWTVALKEQNTPELELNW